MTKQCKRVLAHLQHYGSIQPLESWQQCGVYRLASRIHDLRKAGYPILDRWIKIQNQFGENVKFKQYYLDYSKKENSND